MDEKTVNKNEEIEIDLSRLFGAVVSKSWLVATVALICAVVAFLGTFFFITPQYQSSAMFYVNNTALSVGSASLSLSSSDISASRGLVKTYIVILDTRETLLDVIDYAGVNRTVSEVKGMIEAESVDNTEVFRVVVTSPDPQEAEQIANAIAYILPKRISSIVEGTSAKVVDAAVAATRPSSPSYTKNTLLGFIIGFALTVAVIALREMFDISVRAEEDIEQVCNHPVLATVPDMSVPGKGGYYYGYGAKKKAATTKDQTTVLVGADISFAASEAYKLLRTKLQYSFADEKSCRVIGVSSAMTGEGKSLTAVNLAYTLSQLNKRVLLIDCDMRRPSLDVKLPVSRKPGLSGFLSGQNNLENLIQLCGLQEDENAFHVISAGQNPPNPVELLSSARMVKMLTKLRTVYDYVILDLPPIGEVSDALAVSKETDGILLVVRQNYCNRPALNAAVRQFEFVESRLLGVVYNCAAEETKGYGKKYYNKKYYQRSEGRFSSASKE